MIVFIWSIDDSIVSLPINNGNKIEFYGNGKSTIIEVKHASVISSSEIPQVLKEYYYINLDSQSIGIILRTVCLDYHRLREKSIFRDPDIITRLAHNSLVIDQRTIPYFTKEAVLAYKIAKKYSKDKTLEFYLNKIYFGHGIFGFEAASYYYFEKSTSQLQIHEIAFLVSISMDYLHPDILKEERVLLNPENAKFNRDKILGYMAGRQIITSDQAEKSKIMPLRNIRSIPCN